MDPIATAHYGMMAATHRFDEASRTVGSAGVAMAEAEARLEANAPVVRSGDEMPDIRA